jgi:predicted ester cyclase
MSARPLHARSFAAMLLLALLLLLAAAAAARTPPDLLERNKALVRRVYEEGLNRGVFEVPYRPDFVGHGGAATFTHEQGISEARGWRAAFPDLHMHVDLILAEADLVSVRWTARGTNSGSGNGLPATGKSAQVTGTTIFRIQDGEIAEEWTSGDSLGLMKQLGLLPPPAPAN